MTQTISFINPGEIDPRLITTMGCNVKETESPIGYFGTGLKYAIAVLLRSGQQVTIWSGLTEYKLECQISTMRGKNFSVVHMNEESVGFTTELGKNWTMENAYRELYCNSVDERGETTDSQAQPLAGQTTIWVEGEEFAAVHRRRGSFILEFSGKKKLFSHEKWGEIWEGPGQQMFYKGIAVGKHLGGDAKYTYNITSQIKLSEDRLVAEESSVRRICARMLSGCTDRSILRNSLLEDKGPEQYFYFSFHAPTEEFLDVTAELLPQHKETMNKEAKLVFYKTRGVPKPNRRAIEMSPEERLMLGEAKELWLKIGVVIDNYPIRYVHSIDSGNRETQVFACAEDGQIWLTPECFAGQELLNVAVFEEWLHLNHKVKDETREMQNVLFKYISTLAQRIQNHD